MKKKAMDIALGVGGLVATALLLTSSPPPQIREATRPAVNAAAKAEAVGVLAGAGTEPVAARQRLPDAEQPRVQLLPDGDGMALEMRRGAGEEEGSVPLH